MREASSAWTAVIAAFAVGNSADRVSRITWC